MFKKKQENFTHISRIKSISWDLPKNYTDDRISRQGQ